MITQSSDSGKSGYPGRRTFEQRLKEDPEFVVHLFIEECYGNRADLEDAYEKLEKAAKIIHDLQYGLSLCLSVHVPKHAPIQCDGPEFLKKAVAYLEEEGYDCT